MIAASYMNSSFKHMCRVWILALCLAWATGPVMANSAERKTYDQIIQAWQARDADKLASLYAQSSATFASPGAGGQLGAQDFKSYAQALFVAVPDFKLTMKQSAPIGKNGLFDQWEVTGTWTQPFPGGPLAGMPASGKSFVLPGTSVHQTQNGQLVSTVQYYDNLSFLQQIGAIPSK